MTKINKSVLLMKLDILQRTVSRLGTKKEFTLKELSEPSDLQDIVLFNVQKSVQICVDIAGYIVKDDSTIIPPQTMAECFDRLAQMKIIDEPLAGNLKKPVGLRNIIVHEYDDIDWQVINDVVKNHPSTFKEFARQVLEYVEK